MKKWTIVSLVCFLTLGLLFYGCGGGGSSGSSNTTLSGKVADGYVKNAQVFVYNDAGMTNQIGSGTTDDNGNFSITLNVSSIPDTVYIKSVGGTVIDTGMPAPTMLFVGSNDLGTFNVTPLTDSLYKYTTSKGGMNSAADYMKNKLGMNDTNLLWGDPVANSDLQNALYKVLSSGTQSGTLPDGDYKVVIIYLDEDNIGDTYTGINDIITNNKVEMNVSITNGTVSGTMVGSTDIVTGKVQGSSIVLNILNSSTSPTEITRVAGSIGLLGSVAGVYTNLDASGLSKGVFVASFIPASGVDVAGVARVIENLYSGPRHTLFRDVFGTDSDLAWGDVTITNIDPVNGTVSAQDTTITLDAGSAAGSSDTLTFNSGVFLQSNGLPANIIILKFTDNSNDLAYFIQPIGSRRGIYMAVDHTTNQAYAIGDAYMSKSQSFAPSLDSNTQYSVRVAVAHPGMLRQLRTAALMSASDSFTTPDFTNAPYDNSGGVLKVFNGSIIAFKHDTNNNNLSDGFNSTDPDYMRLVELYETGAMQGEEMIGGTITDPTEATVPLKKFPATFVGFLKKTTETAPSFSGTMNFLARVLYTTDYSTYLNAYTTGTLSISGTSATLSWVDADGDSGTASLNVTNDDGLYHIYGALGTEYIDIYWPIGGQKAVYIHSDQSDGNGTIDEVGEAYLTY